MIGRRRCQKTGAGVDSQLEARLEKRAMEAVKMVEGIKDQPVTNRVLVECTARLVGALCRNEDYVPDEEAISESIWDDIFQRVFYGPRPSYEEEEAEQRLHNELQLYREAEEESKGRKQL